jgi:hypothetical protein
MCDALCITQNWAVQYIVNWNGRYSKDKYLVYSNYIIHNTVLVMIYDISFIEII